MRKIRCALEPIHSVENCGEKVARMMEAQNSYFQVFESAFALVACAKFSHAATARKS